MQARQLANPKTIRTHSLNGEVSRTSSAMPRVKDHVQSLAVVERSGPSPEARLLTHQGTNDLNVEALRTSSPTTRVRYHDRRLLKAAHGGPAPGWYPQTPWTTVVS
nr:hypothetical protein [Tanacetum cinerariifolium]